MTACLTVRGITRRCTDAGYVFGFSASLSTFEFHCFVQDDDDSQAIFAGFTDPDATSKHNGPM